MDLSKWNVKHYCPKQVWRQGKHRRWAVYFTKLCHRGIAFPNNRDRVGEPYFISRFSLIEHGWQREK